MAFLALTQRPARAPRLHLAAAAAETFAEQQASRRAAKAKRPLHRVLRYISMGFAVLFLAVALAGGTGAQKAQAGWWWDDAKNVAAGVLNWCGPENVPAPASRLGLDTELFGLGKDSKGNVPQVKADRASVAGINSAASASVSGADGSTGLSMLNTMFDDAKHIKSIKSNGYSSYGISTLKWTQYGAQCMSQGATLTGVSNILLLFLVIMPSTLAMALVSFALNNVLYTGFAAMVQPMVSALSNIVQPWMWVLVLAVGLPAVWLKSKGSLSRLLSATAWVALIGSLFVYLNYNTSSVVTFANNAVSNLSSFAACTFLQNPDLSSSNALLTAGGGKSNGTPGTITSSGGGGCSTNIVKNVVQGSTTTFNMADSGIAQQIWYDIPYRVWSMGEVGPDQSSKDFRIERDGNSVSWSAAILNGLYAKPGDDNSIRAAVSLWNQGSYGPADKENSKPSYWTDPNGADSWVKADGSHYQSPFVEVPFLATVKAMCADTTKANAGDGAFSGDAKDNQWMYSGNCDTAKAGTANVVETFTGNAFEQRASAAFSGGIAMLIILGVLGTVSIYLAFQKLAFFFLWMFAPLLLAIGAFPDEKRSQFAKKFGEQLLSNIIKQVVAVIALLFVVSSIGSILGNSAIPWMMKPMSIISFWIAMLVFAIPFTKVLRAAAKGDASIVNKIADAPAKAVKVAAVGTALAATAAVAAPALIGAAGGLGSVGGMSGLLKAAPKALGPALQGLGRMTGGHKGMAIRKAGAMASFLGNTTKGAKMQHLQDTLGIDMLDAADRKAMGEIDPTTGLPKKLSRFDRVGGTGALTDKGRAAALAEWRTTMAASGGVQDQTKQAEAAKSTFFRTYAATHNGQLHPLDPKLTEAAAKGGVDAQGAEQAAKRTEEGSQQAAARGAESYDARPNYAKDTNVVASATAITQQRFDGNPAAAFLSNPEAFEAKYAPTESYDLSGAAAMDIKHPAMQAIMQLNAGIADQSLSGEEIARLNKEVQASLATTGAPAQISHYGLADETVPNFDASNLKNLAQAIPTITVDSIGGEARFESAVRIASVAANMPSDHPLRNEVSGAMNSLWSDKGDEAVAAVNRLSESVHSYIATNHPDGVPAAAQNFEMPTQAPVLVGAGVAAAATAAAPAPAAPAASAAAPVQAPGAPVVDNRDVVASVDRLTEATREQSRATAQASGAYREVHASSANSINQQTESTERLGKTIDRAAEVTADSNGSEDLPAEALEHGFRPKKRRRKQESIYTDGEDND